MDGGPHIRFEFPDYAQELSGHSRIADIEDEKLRIELQPQGITAYASMEWIVPGTWAIWILKSYFDGFLSEAGKEHFVKLKAWLKKLAIESRTIITKTYTADGSKDKVSQASQSQAFSVFVQLKNGCFLKLLFDLELSPDDWKDCIESMMEFISDHHNTFPDDPISKAFPDAKRGEYFYAIIDKEKKEWVLYNTMALVKRAREQSMSK